MKPLVKGQETGLVEIPASWYIDDLPPMMFIKNAPVNRQQSLLVTTSNLVLELTRLGKPP